MLNSGRRSLEGLGHTHGLLETDLFSGIVELLAEQPADAETVLRRAYDGFVARGVGVDAARALAGGTPPIPTRPAPTSSRRRVRGNLATAAQLRGEPGAETLASLGERHGLARRPMHAERAEPAVVEVARTDALGAIVH